MPVFGNGITLKHLRISSQQTIIINKINNGSGGGGNSNLGVYNNQIGPIISNPSTDPTIVNGVSPFSVGGNSYLFNGASQRITITNNFNLGANDFTIEWFQKQISSTPAAQRPFSIGAYPNVILALSIELGGSGPLFWYPPTGRNWTATNYNTSNLLNVWRHIAIVRNNKNFYVYIDGVLKSTVTSFTSPYNYNTNITIGGEDASTSDRSGYFNGYITSFRFVKSNAIYTSNFTPPTTPLTNITNTVVLLNP